MSMSIAVEKIEKGDRIEFWLGDAPQSVVVSEITEGRTVRIFQVNHSNGSFELNVPRGHEVNLVC
jgi:hypothetical protein